MPETTTELPAPLTPADCDLRDFGWTAIYRSRLFSSSFQARASDAVWRAGVTLWLKSWEQSPAGSLPSDDVELCRLAELGRDLKTWRKVRDDNEANGTVGALHGWVKCSDGRLYHKVVAEGVMEAWDRKQAQRDRTLRARIAALQKRLLQMTDNEQRVRVTEEIERLSRELPQKPPNPVTDSDAESIRQDLIRPDQTGQGSFPLPQNGNARMRTWAKRSTKP